MARKSDIEEALCSEAGLCCGQAFDPAAPMLQQVTDQVFLAALGLGTQQERMRQQAELRQARADREAIRERIRQEQEQARGWNQINTNGEIEQMPPYLGRQEVRISRPPVQPAPRPTGFIAQSTPQTIPTPSKPVAQLPAPDDNEAETLPMKRVTGITIQEANDIE